ncbi:hypothetical protein BVRB_8g186620 [Beta vulgaris subsp. vulgaris]|uniref:Pentacotripeptide-repeat region of PRORP domain-containing protein n=1 Tax=Beta vulgaris subsp. vulgaris TaxID=3555 RepID=A0A0J8BRE4_BETVV|nr:hypothetical protein BVRB_8g186620 [Beta vulgaris subsp. vulgaris]
MSNPCSHLRKILKTSAAAPTSTLLQSAKPTSIPISVKELVEESNLEELAKKFKQVASNSSKFRNRHNIYDFTISRLALAKRYNLIEDILESHKNFDDITREGFAIRLISLYARAGMFDHARKVFDEMPELKCPRTVKSFNAVLKAGVEAKRFEDVFRLFREGPATLSISCDVLTYNIVIHAFCETGSVDEGLMMVDEMMEKGVNPSVVTFNTLLDGFYREKGFEGGEIIWSMMDELNVVRNTRSYNLKMQGMVNEGELRNAVALFEVLESEGLKPDVSTFNVLMKGCCDQGNVEEAKKWYNALLESGAMPNSITFSTIVPKFCDRGDFDLAFELCKKMFKRQFVVDEALLQLVVNGLVKASLTEEAEELVKLGKSNSYVQYDLVLPSDNAEN